MTRAVTKEQLVLCRRELYKSARAWLEKRQPKGWRRPNRKRVKALMVLQAFSTSIRKSLPLPGIGYFCQPHDPAARKRPALSWPTMSMCTDFGSDILAALNFATRDKRVCLNADFAPGLSHGCWNATKAS